jgi:predicted TPR repeat methyltransferase
MAKKPSAPPRPAPRAAPAAGLSGQLLRMAGVDSPVAADFEAVAHHLAAQPATFGYALPDANVEDAVERARAAAAAEPDNPLRQLQLADALRRAGRDDEARAAAERCLALDPDAVPARFLLAALGGAATPETMPAALVATIFDNAAASFDRTLVGALKYRGPEAIAQALRPFLPPSGRKLDILDAGCGTGLCVPHLAPLARRLDGIDLAPKMIEAARARRAYDRLSVGDVVDAMRRAPGTYDLVVAADVLVYLGALEPFFAAAHAALRPRGLLAYSVERGSGGGYALSRASRYQHDPAYVEAAAAQAGFALRDRQDCVLRFEGGKPVQFLVYVHARRA